MTLTLQRKLLILLVLAIGLSTLLVGGSLAWYSQRLHKEEAEQQFEAARQVVASILARLENSTRTQAAVLAGREDILAPLNMISRYESQEDYQPLVFDPEKQRLTAHLAHEVLSHRGDVSDRLVALYDGRGDLVSFAVAHEDGVHSGFVTYRDGRAEVVYSDAGGSGALPPLLLFRYAGKVGAPAGVRYMLRGDTLFVQSSKPLERVRRDGTRQLVGRAVVGGLLDTTFVENVTREAGIHLALAGPDADDLRVAEHRVDARDLREGAPPWQGTGQAETIDTSGLLVKRFTLPLVGDERPALLLMAVDKGPLLAQMRHTRDIVLLVLLATGVLAIPFGAYVGKRSFADPIGRLVRRVEAVRRGDYKGGGEEDRRDDELGWLGRNISAMADTIRMREQDLRDSQVSLNEAQRIAQLGNWDWNSTDGRLRCSDEIGRILETPPETLAGRDYRFILPHVVPDDRGRVAGLLESAVRDGVAYQAEYRLLRSDGGVQEVYEQLRVDDAPSGNRQLFGTLQVVTELRKVEAALRRSNRALRTLSACNEDLVHAECEQELLDWVCRDLVRVGEYRLAWIGFAEQGPERRVRPVARAGGKTDYLQQADIRWDDSPQGQGPTGTAIRTGRMQVMRDIQHDPAFKPWREAAVERGYASSIAFPLIEKGGTTFGALNLYSGTPDAFDENETALLGELAGDIAFGITNLRMRQDHEAMSKEREQYLRRLQGSMQSTVQVLSSTIELRDPYTAGHQRRVAELAAAIASAMKMDSDRVHGIYLAGVIHDVGKVNIPAEILSKPGRLTDVEMNLIRTHPAAGYEILKAVEFPWPIADIVHQHHERLDGSGYPRGLKGDEIRLEARIICVADVVEAMASYRPYRPGLGIDTALEEIEKNRGRLYDPEIADVCIRLFRKKGFEFSRD